MSEIKLALGMIVLDEFDRVQNLLTKLKDEFDEVILVLDNPNPKIISKFETLINKFSCKIIASEGKEYARRSLYLKESFSDWLLALDTDEFISIERVLKLKNELKRVEPNVGAIRLPILNYFGRGRWTTTFSPRVIRLGANICYNEQVQHTTVSESVFRNNMLLGRSSEFIEHYGSIVNETEFEKRKRRIRDMKLSISYANSFFYAMLAVEYISLGDIQSGIKYIELSLKSKGDKDFANYLKGLLLYRFNLTWAAREQLNFVTKQVAFCGEASLLLADLDTREGHVNRGLQRIEQYVNLHPDSTLMLLNYAALAVDLYPAKAIEYSKHVLDLQPSLFDPLIYSPGTPYNPYSFQDTFVCYYRDVFAILAKAYKNLGCDRESKYWGNYKFI